MPGSPGKGPLVEDEAHEARETARALIEHQASEDKREGTEQQVSEEHEEQEQEQEEGAHEEHSAASSSFSHVHDEDPGGGKDVHVRADSPQDADMSSLSALSHFSTGLSVSSNVRLQNASLRQSLTAYRSTRITIRLWEILLVRECHDSI